MISGICGLESKAAATNIIRISAHVLNPGSTLQTLAHDGVGGLYRGFGPAIARSFPANGACFLVYELASSALKQFAEEPAPEVLATDAGR